MVTSSGLGVITLGEVGGVVCRDFKIGKTDLKIGKIGKIGHKSVFV